MYVREKEEVSFLGFLFFFFFAPFGDRSLSDCDFVLRERFL